MLLSFEKRAAQRRLVSKIKAKFRTYHCKIRRGVGENAEWEDRVGVWLKL